MVRDGKRLLNSQAACALGSGMQFRYLGSAVGLGLVTAVLDNGLHGRLGAILSSGEVTKVLESVEAVQSLPVSVQSGVEAAFEACFSLEWQALLGLVCAQIPAALMML